MTKVFSFVFLSFYLLLSTSLLAQFSAGAGLALGSKIDGVSVQFRGAYDFIDAPVRISADIIRSFGAADRFRYSTHLTEYNVNAHYKVVSEDSHSVYGLVGFNLSKPAHSLEFLSYNLSANKSIVGWNLGAGTQYEVAEQIAVVGEVKYIVGEARQWVLALGGVWLF